MFRQRGMVDTLSRTEKINRCDYGTFAKCVAMTNSIDNRTDTMGWAGTMTTGAVHVVTRIYGNTNGLRIITSHGAYRRPQYDAHPNDCSVMTYRGHAVLRTLIRCHFSPTETTGGNYIYSGSLDGKIHVRPIVLSKAALR